jgi:hypothetical protein
MPTKTYGVTEILRDCPRIERLIKREDTVYMGPCVVQDPGSWSRIGPTWLVKGVGWVCIGLGVKTWGTTEGLAELATKTTAKPAYHALGLSVSQTPNIVFAVTAEALGSKALSEVKSLSDEAEGLAK